jgi:ABC-type oligopeptide transport system substrate-binding subunit
MGNKIQRLMVFIFLMITFSCVPKNKKSGNTINYNIGGEPTTLSPLSASDAYSTNIHSYIFENLLERDIETYEWKPMLATDWSISKDKRVFDVQLLLVNLKVHHDIHFHIFPLDVLNYLWTQSQS